MAGELDSVISGETIEAAWGNDIRDRVISRYATATERDTLNPSPSDGDMAYLENVDILQQRQNGGWHELFGANSPSMYLDRASNPSDLPSLMFDGLAVISGANQAYIGWNVYRTSTGWGSDAISGSDDVSLIQLGLGVIEFLAEDNYTAAGEPDTMAVIDPGTYDVAGSGRARANLRAIFFGTTLSSTDVIDGDLFAVHSGPDADIYLRESGSWQRLKASIQSWDVAATQVISAGSITPLSTYQKIDTAGGASTDDLTDIVGEQGQLVILRTITSARDVVVKHNTSKIALEGSADFTLATAFDTLTLVCVATNLWVQVAGSNL